MITTCSGDDHAPAPDRFHAGASFGVFGSSLSFAGGPSVDIERRAVSASLEYRISPDMTVGGGAGAGIGGLFTVGAERHKVLPGWLVTATWSRRLVDGTGRKPFLLIGLAFGASGASTRRETTGTTMTASTESLYALDLRVALTIGKTFWNVLSPYASARAFGGPVFWSYQNKSVVGSDKYHFQIALGMVAALPRGFDVFVDGSPGGERAITLGAGKSF